MKIKILAFLMVILTAMLTGCLSSPEMRIEKATLTSAEQDIASLLGAGGNQLIYDFVLDNSVKAVAVNTYELFDGEWRVVSGGDQPFSDSKGRLALNFADLSKGVRVALQSENNNGSTGYSREPDGEDMSSRAVSVLDHSAEIAYEKEIPLAVQISTSKNSVRSFGVESFFTPEDYEENGYEQVYAVTIRFSQKEGGQE